MCDWRGLSTPSPRIIHLLLFSFCPCHACAWENLQLSPHPWHNTRSTTTRRMIIIIIMRVVSWSSCASVYCSQTAPSSTPDEPQHPNSLFGPSNAACFAFGSRCSAAEWCLLQLPFVTPSKPTCDMLSRCRYDAHALLVHCGVGLRLGRRVRWLSHVFCIRPSAKSWKTPRLVV